jgi:hypothetical protein
MRIRTSVGWIVAAVAIASCDSSESPFVPTQESSDDAMLISMVLGRTIRPDAGLARSVALELDAIRGKYATQIPEVLSLRPIPPWEKNVVTLWMTEGAADSVRQDTYTAWNRLNETEGARLQRINSYNSRAYLQFDDWIHPRLMAQRYIGLPGVIQVSAAGLCCDWPNLYPLQRDGGRTYLFRKASGDCPAGCIENEYWYFRATRHGIEFVGGWNPRFEPTPAWWDEAKENRDFFPRW